MEKTGLIFDMDGTLWDSAEKVAESWTLKMTELYPDRAPITTEDIKSVMGLTMDKIADIMWGDLSEEEQDRLLTLCGDFENDYLREHGGTVYDKLPETMLRLKEMGYHLYIVSNCQSGYIEAFLDYYKFWDLFEDIECYGNNNLKKGDNIKNICDRNNLTKAYYIGDIEGDYQASKEAGVAFIHAAYGFGEISDEVPFIDELSKLPELMETLG